MTADFDIDPELVQKLAQLLVDNGLSEIEYESGTERIRVVRAGAAPTAPVQAAPAAQPAAPASGDVAAAGTEAGTMITSPMVGTAYLSPEPGAPPYVRVGDAVVKDQILMLIEAMKTYNPLRAPQDGRILRILIEDSTPVEFGEDLMLLG